MSEKGKQKWGPGKLAKTGKAFETGKFQDGTEYELFHGEHPHSTSDNCIYARWGKGKEKMVEGFDGHRIRVKVEIESYNYLKTSDLSGNEIRRAGQAKIFFNDEIVYGFFFRDPLRALLEAHRKIEILYEHSSQVWRRDELVGKKIFYRDTPAVIEGLVLDQGSIMIALDKSATKRTGFPLACWEDEGETERDRVKDDLLSPHIWWHRK